MKTTVRIVTQLSEPVDAIVALLDKDNPRVPDGLNDEISQALERLIAKQKDKDDDSKETMMREISTGPDTHAVLLPVWLNAGTNTGKLLKQAANAIRRCGTKHDSSVLLILPTLSSDDTSSSLLLGALIGTYTFGHYQSKPKSKPISCLYVLRDPAQPQIEQQLPALMTIADSVALACDLVNEPPNIADSAYIAEQALTLGAQNGFDVKVLQGDELQQQQLTGLAAVSASSNDARMIVLDYTGDTNAQLPMIALVGKGVTFDSGGLSLKPSKNMHHMKTDMAGAAAVLGLFAAASQLKLPICLKGYLPCCSNLPGGKAYRPADILRMRNGTTVEIQNTDAEGRLILADALCLAAEQQPDAIIDLATLTGACLTALGHEAAGLMSTHQDLADQLMAAANASGERLWPLPLYEGYTQLLTSRVADIANIGSKPVAGASLGAAFLRHFVGDVPWAHLDIAGVAEHESAPFGASGFGVRLLLTFLNNFHELQSKAPGSEVHPTTHLLQFS